jgi:hypothetical protein
MRYIALHDEAGNILALAGSPDDGPSLLPVPEAGQSLQAAELPEDVLSALDSSDEARVTEMIQQIRLDIASAPVVHRKAKSQESRRR